MVPVIWAFFSAEVNAGTASAARIAIIAITTSNSINVKALTRSRCFGRVNPPSHQATADRSAACRAGAQRRREEDLFILIFIGVSFLLRSAFARGYGGQVFWRALGRGGSPEPPGD